MAKKPREKINSKAWLETYGDMITLVLCFFVMLFSMSTIDAQKWRILVHGFNPDAEETSQIILDQDTNPTESTTAIDDGGDTLMDNSEEIQPGAQGETGAENESIQSMNELYEALQQYVKENNLQDQIQMFKGDNYTYIMFSNNIFFAGDSSVLRKEGREILDVFSQAIGQVSDLITKIQVLGHTNQADPNKPNNVSTDRFLSSNRAVEVLVYIQQKNLVNPAVLESIGFGQHYPIGSFDDPEGRAKNRRVELILAEDPTAQIDLERIYNDIRSAQASGTIDSTIIDN